ncbi:MAG: T9SS type A sorting domain-containing protein [Flavobacteriales bacterium]
MRYILLIALSVIVPGLFAQSVDWVKTWGGVYGETIIKACGDEDGNLYMVIGFEDTVDADPGPGTINFFGQGSLDMVIVKTDSGGNFIWAKQFGGPSLDQIRDIKTDTTGNVYITGIFFQTVDFDPGPGTFNLTSTGDGDGFIVKLNSTGNLIWAKQLTGSQEQHPYTIELGSNQTVFITGNFWSTTDFDPGLGTYNLISASLSSDIFALHLDANGNFIWAFKIGGPGGDYSYDLQFDTNGDFYLTGSFKDNVDFDPGPGTFIMQATPMGTNTNAYVVKFDSLSNFIWAVRVDATWASSGSEIEIEGSGDVLLIGDFSGVADLDPAIAMLNYTSVGWPTNLNRDIFILKLTSSGAFLQAVVFTGGGMEENMEAYLDANDNIYLTGTYTYTLDADPDTVTSFALNAGSTYENYLIKLNSDLTFHWATELDGGLYNVATALMPNPSGGFYWSGYFSQATDFDLTSGVNTISPPSPSSELFLLKFHEEPCFTIGLSLDSIHSISCTQPGFARMYAYGGTNYPYMYTWNTSPVTNDSVATFTTGGFYTITVSDLAGCNTNRTLFINGPTTTTGFDLETNIISGTFWPGNLNTFFIDATNSGCDSVSGMLTLVLDTALTFITASPAPDGINGDTLTWNFSNINYDIQHLTPYISVVPSSALTIIDSICLYSLITPVSGDQNPINNTDLPCYSLVNSFDPNDKQVSPAGVGPMGAIPNNQTMTYAVRFQNTGTAPAVNVYIIDTISANLDINTLSLVANSHAMVTELLSGNILKFRFDNIMLPDSGTNEPASHGYLVYHINQVPSLPDFSVISNTAYIYFDYNIPVVTNTVSNVIDPSTFFSIDEPLCIFGVCRAIVYPNPAYQQLTIEILNARGIVNASLVDLFGRKIKDFLIHDSTATIDITSIPDGMYILTLQEGQGVTTRKIQVVK